MRFPFHQREESVNCLFTTLALRNDDFGVQNLHLFTYESPAVVEHQGGTLVGPERGIFAFGAIGVCEVLMDLAKGETRYPSLGRERQKDLVRQAVCPVPMLALVEVVWLTAAALLTESHVR